MNFRRFPVLLTIVILTVLPVLAQDFTVERATNLSQLSSWSDNSQFQWQAIDHDVIDNSTEMNELKTFFSDYAPKDTAGLYNRIYDIRDNQYTDHRSRPKLLYRRVTIDES